MTKSRIAASLFSLGILLPIGTHAQDFPSRPLRLVVPFAAGGAVDTTARIVGQKVSERAGQAIIIDNRGGAAGNIGSEMVAKAASDGYTLLQTVNGLSLGASTYKKLSFDAAKDFVPIAQITESPLVIVASGKTQIKSIADLVAIAKRKPGVLNYGSTGVGVSLHLAMEMVKLAAGIDIVHIPFKGDAPLLNALIAGDVDVACVPIATSLAHVQAGTLRALAVTSPQRTPLMPDVPTVVESGFPSVETVSWQGWFAPAGTPKPIVVKLNGLVREALKSPEIIDRFKSLGMLPADTSPETFDAFFKADIGRWAKVVREINLPPQD